MQAQLTGAYRLDVELQVLDAKHPQMEGLQNPVWLSLAAGLCATG